jgi:tRNA(Ile)-lysidine synthase
MRPSSSKFGPAWLVARLASLLPGYPRVSLCVALSGGVDSTALLAALAAGRPKSIRLRALHVDHGLRPASKQWARHCRVLARRLHVPLEVLVTKVDRARGESLEAAAREARYRLLATALEPGEVLLTAHHRDDQLETVLLQLLRGGGLPGMAAMSELAAFANGWLARPLLSRSRAELEAWVQESGLTWVEDDTNVDERLDRNYLRRRILPLIHERWPGSATAVARSARHAAEAQTLLNSLARFDGERASYGESLSVKTLRALPPDRLRNALRFWITQAGWMAPDTRRLEEIAGPLLKARPDANPFVEWDALQVGAYGRAGIRVRVQRYCDLLSLSPTVASLDPALTAGAGRMRQAARASPSLEIAWSWRDCSACELPGDLGKLELEPDEHGPINLDALPHVLTIRWRRGGERLSPRRSGPRRALKSLLQEAHVPVAERGRLPLLFSVAPSSAKLIAVADLLLDETVQATSATRRRARLRWRKSHRESV